MCTCGEERRWGDTGQAEQNSEQQREAAVLDDLHVEGCGRA